MKQPIFDPRNPKNPPESCGYGLRLASISLYQERLEFKSQAKLVESSIKLSRIFKTLVPGMTLELLKNEKRKKQGFLPFSLVLEEGGKIDFIARNEKELTEFVNGINAIIIAKKTFFSLRNKVEVCCY